MYTDYCIRHIFRGGFIFTNFASRVLFANSTTHTKFTSEPDAMNANPDNATCVSNTSSTVRARANE